MNQSIVKKDFKPTKNLNGQRCKILLRFSQKYNLILGIFWVKKTLNVCFVSHLNLFYDPIFELGKRDFLRIAKCLLDFHSNPNFYPKLFVPKFNLIEMY